MPVARNAIRRELKEFTPLRNWRLEALFRKCGKIRGYQSENDVEEALQRLLDEGRITHFFMTKKRSHKDRHQIDACAILINGVRVPIQVKSSPFGIRKHNMLRTKYGGEEIIVLLGRPLNMTFEEYKKRIFWSILKHQSMN